MRSSLRRPYPHPPRRRLRGRFRSVGLDSLLLLSVRPIHTGAACAPICGPSAWTLLFPSPCGATHDVGLLPAAGRRPAFPSSLHPAPQPPRTKAIQGGLPTCMPRRPSPWRAHRPPPGAWAHIQSSTGSLTGSLACPSPSTRCVTQIQCICNSISGCCPPPMITLIID
jgi:hypothetical protein